MMTEKKTAALNLEEMDQLAGGMGTPASDELLTPIVELDEGDICRFPDGSEARRKLLMEEMTPFQRAEHLPLTPMDRTGDEPLSAVDVAVLPASNMNTRSK